ncbi:MAG: PIN domain-containing protein [Chloroflexota bacterium]|nr:PIN domain-containing protein [Chloroflexota bacterium]
MPPADIVVCSVVRGELAFGSAKGSTPQQSFVKRARFLEPYHTLPYDDAAAYEFGHIRAVLQAAGTPISPYDLQIAAIALVHSLIVVTHNVSEFRRVVGLQVEDRETD